MENVNEVLQNLRGSYLGAKFDLKDADHDPVVQFEKWLKEAISSLCDEPNAFTLSTVSGMRPRGRVVLLKGITQNKFVFYTNYGSAKGNEIRNNDLVALTFLWLPLQRQVRIEGRVTMVDPEASDAYFKIRPRGSQIGAIASPQSQKISTREELEQRFLQVAAELEGQDSITRPTSWGGYQVTPDYFEFWQGRSNRLHDRISYELTAEGWQRYRLAP
jgi:pyridoxamine 5'-phosphate oxidase